MSDEKVTPEQKAALEAIHLKVFGEDKPNISYVKLEDQKPVVLYFEDWSKKDQETGEFVNMWEEEIPSTEEEGKSYKVVVFRVLDMTSDKQEEKTLSVSSKRLFNKIQRMLTRGFSTLEITKMKGQTKFDTDYDVIPAGAGDSK